MAVLFMWYKKKWNTNVSGYTKDWVFLGLLPNLLWKSNAIQNIRNHVIILIAII